MKVDWAVIKKEFYAFIRDLKIESKEEGIVFLGNTLLGSQKYFIEEVFGGLANGVHYFVTLKARQMGISTIMLAMDLFWHFRFPGTQGTLITDTDENKAMFRTTLTLYIVGLPPGWKLPVEENNRTQLTFGNRSRIAYIVAGTRKNVGLGAGKALSFVHATETGKWGPVDMPSLEASLAENNPLRLYVWESTAYGFGNVFYEMWEVAGTSESQMQIFIGFWRNDTYRRKRGTEIYKVYWDGTLTDDEKKWVAEVKELYDYDIDDEQIAWWRWKLYETAKGDENEMYEKYPPTAEYAFVMTGSQFFSSQRLTDQRKVVRNKPYDIQRFYFGGAFEDTELIECNEKTATLKIWQHPVARGQYVIGGDPAWGSSEWADRFCLSEDTELLTNNGWKKYNEIKIGDQAACFDLKTERYTYGDVQDMIVQHHDGPMVHYKSRSMDCLSTPEHRVVVKIPQNATGRRSHGKWSFRRADNLPRHFRVPLGGAPIGKGVDGLTVEMCRIIGWLASDGHHVVRPPNSGAIKRKWIGGIILVQALSTCKKGVYIAEEMKALLRKEFCIAPTLRQGGPSINRKDGRTLNQSPSYLWYIPVSSAEKSLRWFDNGDIHRIPRRIIKRASRKQLEALYLGLMEGDGTTQNGEWTKFYPGKQEGLADDLQEIAMRIGHSVTKRLVATNQQWVVHVARRKWHYIRKRTAEHYCGPVWDITVPSGAFVARRKGTVFVTGNCINVTRCWADGLEQVAEFCTPDMNTTQYAWALLYLAGAYGDRRIGSNIMINIEINGPGQAVWTEIQRLKQVAFMMKDKAELAHLLTNIENFLYKRIDSIGGGYNYHTKTSTLEKERYLNIMKDQHEMGWLVINSTECLDEMKNVVREDGMIGVPGRGKDDRVIAQALACIAWVDFAQRRLIQAGITRKSQETQADMPVEYLQAGRSIGNYLKHIGIRPKGFDVRGPRQ